MELGRSHGTYYSGRVKDAFVSHRGLLVSTGKRGLTTATLVRLRGVGLARPEEDQDVHLQVLVSTMSAHAMFIRPAYAKKQG